MKKLSLSFTLLILAAGCSPQSKVGDLSATASNQVSKDSLVAQLKQQGLYQGTQTSQIDRDYEIVSSTEITYYLKNNRVVSSSRAPKKEETSLLYWRYKFKGKGYREAKIADSAIPGHSIPRQQFACDSLGMGVVYDPSSEQVTQVFYYEAK